VPNLVSSDHLSSANTLSLVASFGTFPFAAAIFSLLAAIAAWLGSLGALHAFEVNQTVLALVVDACTFLTSAIIVWRLPIPKGRAKTESMSASETLTEIKEGLSYIAHEPRVRGIIVGLGFGIIGAGAIIPLGPLFANAGLGGNDATYGVLLTAFGIGASIGVVALLFFQKKVPRESVFDFAVMGAGVCLILTATFTSLVPAMLAVAVMGACAGTSYVTGFTVLQETVQDDLRGRIFATLYTVIRMCLLVALVISPLWSDFWNWLIDDALHVGIVTIGQFDYSFPGVRIALWGGGLITLGAGIYARWSMVHAARADRKSTSGLTSDAAA
jgi:dTMP kinase